MLEVAFCRAPGESSLLEPAQAWCGLRIESGCKKPLVVICPEPPWATKQDRTGIWGVEVNSILDLRLKLSGPHKCFCKIRMDGV